MSENAAASVTLIQAVDAFFFALVFLIFSYGVITYSSIVKTRQ